MRAGAGRGGAGGGGPRGGPRGVGGLPPGPGGARRPAGPALRRPAPPPAGRLIDSVAPVGFWAGAAARILIPAGAVPTVTDTVAMFESDVPSLALNVKESGPLKPAAGVYVVVALTWFGVPDTQAGLDSGSSGPWAGGGTTEKGQAQSAASLARSGTPSAVPARGRRVAPPAPRGPL